VAERFVSPWRTHAKKFLTIPLDATFDTKWARMQSSGVRNDQRRCPWFRPSREW